MNTVGWLARHRAWGFLVVTLVMSSACSGGGSTTTSPTTTTPAAAVTTDVFTGTVPVGGSDVHNFTVALSNGQINVILTAAGPPSTIFMGLGVGTPSNGACSLFSGAAVTTQAGTLAQISGTAQAGSYCVGVYDVGNQTADITYSVTVSHY